MLTNAQKGQVYHKLSNIKSTSLVALTIRKELEKPTTNYQALVSMVKDQIKDNAPVMNIILGADAVVFFNQLTTN